MAVLQNRKEDGWGAATALLLLLLLLLLLEESDTVGFETDFSSLARSPKGEGPTQAECMNVCRGRGGVVQKRNRILVVLHKRCAIAAPANNRLRT